MKIKKVNKEIINTYNLYLKNDITYTIKTTLNDKYYEIEIIDYVTDIYDILCQNLESLYDKTDFDFDLGFDYYIYKFGAINVKNYRKIIKEIIKEIKKIEKGE